VPAVVLACGPARWDAGGPGELHALFSTIGHRLEPAGWDSRFPTLMHELYQGRLDAASVPAARGELARVRAELARLPPAAAIWDIEDLSQRPPGGEAAGPDIDTLADVFLTSDGESLLDELDRALVHAEAHGAALEIRARDPIPKLGLRVGPHVWPIGDEARVTAALQELTDGPHGDPVFEPLAHEGLEGEALEPARVAVAALRAGGARPRTEDGRDLLALLDEALAYASRAGRRARIEPSLGRDGDVA
jgi:hypothetical protein